MINHIKFCLDMIHKYEKMYPQMPSEILVDIIDVVLNRAPDNYFTYELVQEHPEFCEMCGKCCEGLACADFNGRTCDSYDSRFDACKEFPWYDINHHTGLMLDCECPFAGKLAEMILDEEFQKNSDLLSLEYGGGL